jgi:hypothetical protein
MDLRVVAEKIRSLVCLRLRFFLLWLPLGMTLHVTVVVLRFSPASGKAFAYSFCPELKVE